MSGSVLNIEKLNGENYESWAMQMKSLLITMDYWETVMSPVPEDTSGEVKIKWLANDQKALATITLCLKPSELIHVKNCVHAAEAWIKLKEIYRAKTPSRKVNLFKSLFRFQIKNDEKMAVQINNFCSIAESLKEMDIAVPEDLLCVLLLCSLPDDLESFVVAIESRDDLPSLGQLKVKILEEEQRRGSRVDSSGAEKVFAAKIEKKRSENAGRSNYTGDSGNNLSISSSTSGNYNGRNNAIRKRNIQCYACGRRGHIRSECNSRSAQAKVMSVFGIKFSTNKNVWILDSGASSHLCCNGELFNKLEKSTQSILLASGESVNAQGVGDVFLQSGNTEITLRNVLFVPDLHSNILSVSKIISYGHCVTFGKNTARVVDSYGKDCFEAKLIAGIFCVNMKKRQERVLTVIQLEENKRWHSRFGHLNFHDLATLSKQNIVRGMKLNFSNEISCVICAECKIKVNQFKTNKTIYTKNCLELIHSDICGPMRISSQSGSRYFITFIDDFSRYISTYFLKNKSEALRAFKDFVTRSENRTGQKVKNIRSDNGREYLSGEFESFLKEKGINHQLTTSYTPQQNGIAERANRTLVEMARCMLAESKLPQCLWTEAVNTATYLRNRSPTKLLKKTPYECWFNKKPNVLHLKVFGCDVVYLDKKPGKSKFLPKGKKCSFVGYSEHSKAYRLYNKIDKSITISRDVIFFEKSFSYHNVAGETGEEFVSFNVKAGDTSAGAYTNTSKQANSEPSIVGSDADSVSSYEEEAYVPTANVKRKRGRPKLMREGKVGRPRKKYASEQSLELLSQVTTCARDPKTVAEAMSDGCSQFWKDAMKLEYDSLKKNNTWELVNIPESKNIIGSKWVFSTKRHADGTVEKHKARLVAQGCAQKYKVDYSNTYSPVARYSTIRLILALSAQHKLFVNHIDIVAAYLNGELEEEVFMRQPEMFVDKANPHKVCKLKKALYGLKQAGREWNRKIDDILRSIGFERSFTDGCVYHRIKADNIAVIVLYVDDMLVACSSEKLIEGIVSDLNANVEAIDRGPIQYFLGMEISRDSPCGNIQLHQSRFTEELLKEWGMFDCKSSSTPLPCGTVLNKCENKNCSEVFDTQTYQSRIGSLTYLAMISRPDIAHTVSKLSQFNSHPHNDHFVAAKHALRYLIGTTKGILPYISNNDY